MGIREGLAGQRRGAGTSQMRRTSELPPVALVRARRTGEACGLEARWMHSWWRRGHWWWSSHSRSEREALDTVRSTAFQSLAVVYRPVESLPKRDLREPSARQKSGGGGRAVREATGNTAEQRKRLGAAEDSGGAAQHAGPPGGHAPVPGRRARGGRGEVEDPREGGEVGERSS